MLAIEYSIFSLGMEYFFILFSKLNTKSFFYTADRLFSLVKSPIPCGIRQKGRKKMFFFLFLFSIAIVFFFFELIFRNK